MATHPPGGTTGSGKGDTREKAEAAAAEAQERARETAHEAGEQMRGTLDEAKHQASRLSDEAQRRARSLVDRQKESAAATVGGWANALRAAARQLDEQEQGGAGRYMEWAAEGIERFSHSLREQDLDSLLHQTEDFARRQPAVLVGGAVALGFLASRFLKSSAERRRGAGGYGGRSGSSYGRRPEYGAEPSYGAATTPGYAPSTGYDPTTGSYGPGSTTGGVAGRRYPTSAAEEQGRETPPPVGGM